MYKLSTEPVSTRQPVWTPVRRWDGWWRCRPGWIQTALPSWSTPGRSWSWPTLCSWSVLRHQTGRPRLSTPRWWSRARLGRRSPRLASYRFLEWAAKRNQGQCLNSGLGWQNPDPEPLIPKIPAGFFRVNLTGGILGMSILWSRLAPNPVRWPLIPKIHGGFLGHIPRAGFSEG